MSQSLKTALLPVAWSHDRCAIDICDAKMSLFSSGSALNWWASIPDSRSNAQTVAEAHNCMKDTVKETMDCLRNVDAKELFKTNLVTYLRSQKIKAHLNF